MMRGDLKSASEAIGDGLRMPEDQEAKLAALRTAFIEGEQSGAPKPFDNDTFLARMRQASDD